MGWKSKKDGTHFNTDKIKRSSDGSTEVNIEIDNNSDDFSEGIKKDFENQKNNISNFKHIWPKEGFFDEYQNEKFLDSHFKRVLKNWNEKELKSDEGDGKAIIFTNKSNPEYTVEMHPMDEMPDDEDNDRTDAHYYNAWYMFPAKNGKGITNSPIVVSETGGYSRDDAMKELKKLLISFDSEFDNHQS